MSKQLLNAQQFSHFLLSQCVNSGDIVVDATMGNGHDTLFLAHLVGKNGHVHAFDIQVLAIERTTQLLQTHQQLSQCHLHLKSHDMVHTVLNDTDAISGAIFNLGYLPNSDKSIVTSKTSTLTAISTLLQHLKPNGRIVLVVYYGHTGGTDEKDAVLNYVQQLPQKDYHVLQYAFVNQKNSPPFVIAIEKRK